MLRLLEEKIATPLGPLWVICDEQFRLRAVEWEEYSERMVQLLDIGFAFYWDPPHYWVALKMLLRWD